MPPLSPFQMDVFRSLSFFLQIIVNALTCNITITGPIDTEGSNVSAHQVHCIIKDVALSVAVQLNHSACNSLDSG